MGRAGSKMAMALTSRRAPCVVRPMAVILRSNSTVAADKHVMPGAYSHRDEQGVPYTEQKRNVTRPVSPHVTIYAWPPTSLSSITMRFTGGALSLGMLGMGCVGLTGGDCTSL